VGALNCLRWLPCGMGCHTLRRWRSRSGHIATRQIAGVGSSNSTGSCPSNQAARVTGLAPVNGTRCIVAMMGRASCATGLGRRVDYLEYRVRVGSDPSSRRRAVVRSGPADVWRQSEGVGHPPPPRSPAMSAVPWNRPLAATPHTRPNDRSVSETVSSKAGGHRPKPLQSCPPSA
jgi:hypothetical protein